MSVGSWILICFVSITSFCESKSPISRISDAFAGPFRVKIEDFVDCEMPNVRNEIKFNFKCSEWRAPKDCKRMTGNITFARAFDDFPMINAAYPWRDNQWKQDGIIMKFQKGFEACNKHMPEPCSYVLKNKTSFSPGAFMVDNSAKVSTPSIPVFPYGKWKSLMYGHERQDSPVFCFGVVLNIIPKQKGSILH